MKMVPLLNSDLVAIVDDEDFEKVSTIKWRPVTSPYAKTFYAANQPLHGFMHVFLIGKKAGMVTDHIDNNGLNNRRSNLRHVTQQQNTVRQRMRSDNTSGFRGVYRDERGWWIAQISTKDTTKRLGKFVTPEEAAATYDKAAFERWGEWAVLNFPFIEQEAKTA